MKKVSQICFLSLLLLMSCSQEELITATESTETAIPASLSNVTISQRYTNVTLSSAMNGKFLSSENGTRTMRINRAQAKEWEKFTVLNLGNHQVALQGNNGLYVSSENGERAMSCNRTMLDLWEVFRLEFLGNDQYAIKASNGGYVSYDASTEQLNSQAVEIGKTERFFLQGLPTLPFGTNSLQLVKDDMNLPHQGYPRGVPQGASWAFHPVADDGPPDQWSAMNAWGQAYVEADGSPARNVRLQVRNMQAWYFSRSQRRWIKWHQTSNINGANYVESYSDNENIVADIRDESDNGGGISATVPNGYNFHFWPNFRATVEATDIVGAWVSVEARLIMDNPGVPDDRQQARILLGVGGDYWESINAQWDNFMTNGHFGVGRLRFLSTKWQTFNAHHSLTDEQLDGNPPPFE